MSGIARIIPLASGSEGNATLLDFGSTRLLVDAGLSARTLARRLRSVGVDPAELTCLLLSHEHSDHARGAERFSMRHGVPVVCGRGTLEAMDLSPVHFADWRPLLSGSPLVVGRVRVDAFPVPHDAVEPVGFVVEGAGVSVGVATDLGHATTLVVERLRGCHALVIEFNHDDRMLRDGPYPWRLKQRVGGRMGHLSNDEAAGLLRLAIDDACQAVVLAHLSEHNNTPRRALASARSALTAAGRRKVELTVAARKAPTKPVVLQPAHSFAGTPGQPALFEELT